MKNKTLIIIIILLAVALALAVGFYFAKERGLFSDRSGDVAFPDNGPGRPAEEGQDLLQTEEFFVNIPDGWVEGSAPMGAAAIAVNQNETIKNEAARRINFTSYFSVSYDSLQERTKEEFVQYVKGALAQVASNINYTLEKDIAVDSMDAHALEFELTQQGADFAVLMVLVYGDNGDVWAVSFNTVKEKWDEYKPMFYQTADSFRLK